MQVVVVPVGVKKEVPEDVRQAIDGVVATCKAAGIRVKVDDDVRTTPGFKFNYYEMKVRSLPISSLARTSCIAHLSCRCLSTAGTGSCYLDRLEKRRRVWKARAMVRSPLSVSFCILHLEGLDLL